jgi:asparagine synthetase B (glutamine-hydrolysing)
MSHELRELLEQAVEDARYAAENPCGVLLSGGIDSATIASLAPDLPCFTGYYTAGDAYDERPYARLAARAVHHEIPIRPADFEQLFDQMISELEPPWMGPGTFGQYVVARYATQHVATVLSGEGGDELFGGYARLMIVAGVARPDGYDDYQLPDDYPRRLEEALAYDLERLPDLLRVDEQVCAACGLTAVAPMLDERVVAWTLKQPARLRVGKRLLRDAGRGLVPSLILSRRDKRGFPVPFVEWAQDELRDFIGDRLGYLPDPSEPWARSWWLELCDNTKAALVQ